MFLKEVTDPAEKSALCDKTLRALPQWFGVEKSIVDYVSQVRSLPFFAACEDGAVIGFAALKIHSAYAAEIAVMGVLPEYHRRRTGAKLLHSCEQYCLAHSIEFLTVKTLDASCEYEPYERTRRFYLKAGFRPLEVFPLLWDAENPCLLLAKYIVNPDWRYPCSSRSSTNTATCCGKS